MIILARRRSLVRLTSLPARIRLEVSGSAVPPSSDSIAIAVAGDESVVDVAGNALFFLGWGVKPDWHWKLELAWPENRLDQSRNRK